MMTLLKRDKVNYKILITDDDDDCRYGLNDIFEPKAIRHTWRVVVERLLKLRSMNYYIY